MVKAEELSLLEGIISVKAAVEGKNRTVDKVYIDLNKRKQRDRKIMALAAYLKAENVDFEFLPRDDIDDMVKKYAGDNAGNSHGGVAALVGKRRFLSVEELIKNSSYSDYYVFLDGIEDPYNLGYCIRTLFAMGAKGFILPERDWEKVSSVLARSSAGAWERCDIALSCDDAATADIIEKADIDIVCSALAHDSVEVNLFEPQRPFVLFVGGEKRGISHIFMDKAVKKVHIPYAREDVKYSLPAASVCAVYAAKLYEYSCKKESQCSDM